MIVEKMEELEQMDAKGKKVFVVLDSSGDSKHIWDSSKLDEVDAAKEMFRSLIKKGYAAFRVKKGGEKGEVMRDFDSEAEKVIFAPPIKGGE